MITVVGGVYREHCMHPPWNETYGSAGRAASALAAMGTQCRLLSYLDANSQLVLETRAALENFQIHHTPIDQAVLFQYDHSLAEPRIRNVPNTPNAALTVDAERVVRFGMLEGDAIVNATWAVYDPQNLGAGVPFSANGSTAEHLALILNMSEARHMSSADQGAPAELAALIGQQQGAEVVVIKMGPRGAMVWTPQSVTEVPAYRTDQVWKIGSGDCFVAHFAQGWLVEGLTPAEAARAASKATAYYCTTSGFPDKSQLLKFNPPVIELSRRFLERPTTVYLAGPFFNLKDRWMIEQARNNLREVGLHVFSPFHDVGLGAAEDVVDKDIAAIEASDILFAVVDGLDPGTIYEVGYARALDKPAVVYSESQTDQDLKMMVGSGCTMSRDYATAIYLTLWEAAKIE